MTVSTLRPDLDSTVARRRLLDHPFYKAWADGTLTRDDLSFYSGQYWRQVEAFPGYLESVASRMEEGTPRATLESNLADERDDDHPGLWKDFAAALGRDAVALDKEGIEPETAACVDAFGEAAKNASLPFVLGMLYAYESQTPEVATTKVEGLRQHYRIDGDPVRYFELHGELDVEHSSELAGALEEVVDGEPERAEAIAGARAGADAIWGLLDGVARARGIG